MALRKYFLILTIVFTLFMAIACKGANINESKDSDEPAALALPQPPDTLSKKEKLAYILYHFWDELDFNKHELSLDRNFIEQTFANFAYILNHSKDQESNALAVNQLMSRVEKEDQQAFELITLIAHDYLYDPESPLMNEESYIPFLEYLSKTSATDEVTRSRNKFLLKAALKNRTGNPAEDFSYITPEGEEAKLYDFNLSENQKLILIFYNPDCDSCKETILELKNNALFNSKIKNDEIKVLAIYSGNDENLWREGLYYLPETWIIGFDQGMIEDNDLYYFRTYPSIYVLDKEKNVILKEANIEDLLERSYQ